MNVKTWNTDIIQFYFVMFTTNSAYIGIVWEYNGKKYAPIVRKCVIIIIWVISTLLSGTAYQLDRSQSQKKKAEHF